MTETVELKMTPIDQGLPTRDEMRGEQTILTYNDRVGTWDIAFIEGGWDDFDAGFAMGVTHWLDITNMWPGVTAQVQSFAALTRSDPAVRDRVTDEMWTDLCELPDRTTPEGCDDMVMLTRKELEGVLAAIRTSPPEPASGLQTDFAFTLQPMDSAPSGEDVLEPSEIDVHDGAWAIVLGTNAKPIGWIDTHALFNGRTYRNRLIALTSNQEGNDEA